MKYTKKSLSILSVAILSIGMYAVFPSEGIFQNMVSALFFLVALPMICMKVIFYAQKSLPDTRDINVKNGLLWCILSLSASLVFFALLMQFTTTDFSTSVPLLARSNFMVFLYYNALLSFYVIIYSYFFHQFIIKYLRTDFGIYAVLISIALFIALVGLSLNLLDAYVAMLLAGLTAYYSRSFYFSLIFLILFSLISNGIILIFI